MITNLRQCVHDDVGSFSSMCEEAFIDDGFAKPYPPQLVNVVIRSAILTIIRKTMKKTDSGGIESFVS